MRRCNGPFRVFAGVSFAVFAVVAGVVAAPRAALADAVAFASHRAIYDLKLAASRGSKSIAGIRGRIVYDFSGNACEQRGCYPGEEVFKQHLAQSVGCYSRSSLGLLFLWWACFVLSVVRQRRFWVFFMERRCVFAL